MNFNPDDFIALIANVGFPVTMCFVLLRYILQTIGEKLDKLDNSIHVLIQLIGIIEKKEFDKEERK